MKINFKKNNLPTKPGKYLWRTCYGTASMFTVYFVPAKEGGWGEHLAVFECGGKSVDRYADDEFTDELEFLP